MDRQIAACNEAQEQENAHLRDISECKRMEDLLRALIARQEKDWEAERKRIAWEVHEELGQLLTALQINFSLLHKRLDRDGASSPAQFESMTALLDRSIRVVRTVATDLRPNVLDLGIASAIEWLADEFTKYAAIPCELHLGEEIHMSEVYTTAVFRLAEELLDNVARHADADSVVITLEGREHSCFLEVRDDGRGFDLDMPMEKTLGLLRLKERVNALNGELLISSVPGQGTVTTMSIPIPISRA